ncbi:MAG TPA: hypothetical protein ENH41_00870 [Candidatus Omnitrophica bacterium]|nr:hypothetical protein [Candidatus Omnitrophota bacterium]
MQKITLLVSLKARDSALSVLRKMGVVHIEHMRTPQAEHITSLEQKLMLLDKALTIVAEEKTQKDDLNENEIASYVKEIIDFDKQKQKLDLRIEEFEKERVWFDQWGNVSQSTLSDLEESGVFIKLYTTDKKSLKSIPQDKLVQILREDGNKVYLAFIGSSSKDSLDFVEVLPPSENLHSLERKLETTKDNLNSINDKLQKASSYTNIFSDYKADLLKKLEFCNVRFGMKEDEGISCLEGFCPKDTVVLIRKTADKEGWAVFARDPDVPQEAPTLIKNPKWVEIIKPVFKFMGTLPGYEEYDISFWFLIFFSLFFAMLIGDAGYGLFFLITTFFLQRKFKNIIKGPFLLMYLLSGATIIWGAITGTWFGFEQIAQLPVLNFLVVDRINSFVGSNQIFMIYLCFLIGAIHLSIAHGIIAFRFINSVVALGQLGWICIVWAAFFVAGELVLSRPMPDFTAILGIIGFVLVILFGNPQKNILKGMALSLADLPLKVIGSFSDIVSYLRLFIVGYATVAVAGAFNNMAVGEGINSIFAGLLAAVILFLGHSLNILLGLMSVIVHGIRLNMLEFSGHLNMEWSGKEYRPFKE